MGTINDVGSILFGKLSDKALNKLYSKYVTTGAPVFSSYGNDIMLSDIVKTAIHRVAEAASKSILKSIIEKNAPRRVEIADDELNGVFGGWVNSFMVLKDFIYKTVHLTLRNENCFIYPAFDEVPLNDGTDRVRRVWRALYPLNPSNVAIYYNGTEARIELTAGGATFDMPYADIIHIRHRFGEHPTKGGDYAGKFDARGLIRNLNIIENIKEAIPKSVEAALSVKGILTMRGMPDADKKELKREEFEEHLIDSKYGIVATDYESDFTPININATDLPTNTMNFIMQEILYPYGVSLPIMGGKFTDDEYAAFYQTAVEGLLDSISQTFTAVLFTPRQRAFGHRIKVYDRLVQNLSMDKRIKIVELTKDSALLESYEQRELLGYEPNGQPTRVSLNFIDTDIVNTYQMASLNNPVTAGKKEGNK